VKNRPDPRSPFATAATICLVLLAGSELLVHVAAYQPASLVGRLSFLSLCVVLLRGFALREWVLLVLAVVLGAALMTRKGGLEDAIFALDRAAFFAAFIYLVTLLKEAAQRSEAVLNVGRYITAQPPGRRYYSLATGGHVMGVLLNFGAISLLTPMILGGVRAATSDPVEIARAEQQQISALLRGFAWMIMWSPTALTQAVLFTSFPTINLSIVIPLGIAASVIMVLLGRVESRWRTAVPVNAPVQEKNTLRSAFPAESGVHFLLICAAIVGATFAAVLIFDVSAAIGLMLVAPFFMTGWIFVQENGRNSAISFGAASRTTLDILLSSATSLGRSAFILGAAGFIGEAAARLLPVSTFADQLGIAAMPDWLFLMVLPVLITLGGQVALSPILVVVFLSAIINQLPMLPADPNLIVFALGAGWAMSMTASPNASATLLISGVTNIAPSTLTWRWNGVYSLLCYAVFSVLFFGLSFALPAS